MGSGFDSTNLQSQKLSGMGVSGKLVEVMINAYQKVSAAACLNGKLSESFQCGVHGC